MWAVFKHYDANGNDELEYKEFASILFAKGQAPSGGAAPSSRSAKDLIPQVREKLKARGARGMIGLARSFKIMDDDNSKTL